MTSDPGRKYWIRQGQKTDILTQLTALIESEPWAFTGMTADIVDGIKVYVYGSDSKRDGLISDVERSAVQQGIRITVIQGSRSSQELNRISAEIASSRILSHLEIDRAMWEIDVPAGSVR